MQTEVIITVDEEFAALIPPLSDEEYAQLEANIVADGCRDPLVTWNGILIDGHNRLAICEKHDIPFKTYGKEFESRDDAKIWIIQNQFGRRNISSFVRSELAIKLEPLFTKKAKENQGTRNDLRQKSDRSRSRESKKELAKVAGVSHDTIAKAKLILEKADDETKVKLRQNEVSINEVHKQIKRRERQAESRATKKAKLANRFEGVEIRRGDFREVLSDIPDGSISLILTDPPYGREYIDLWCDLGIFAKTKLASDGLLIAYSGQMYLPQVFNALCESLFYWWTFAVFHEGSGGLTPLGSPVRKVIPMWKPLVVFHNGLGFDATFKDVVPACKPDKQKHNWSQGFGEAKWLIETYCHPGGLVVDPFSGAGTIGAAAKEAGFSFVGAEILHGCAEASA